jgi:hypothetical protein
MTRLLPFGRWFLCFAVAAAPVSAQDEDRIWGRVHTTGEEVHEGFIRWDRNEGSWVDILDGTKVIPDENYLAWLEAQEDTERPVRTLELMGYRITWDESDPDFPTTATAGVRFGHLRELIVIGDDAVEVVLRSGEVLELSGGSTDLGFSIRDVVVEVPGSDPVALDWSDLDRIEFSAVPPGVRASSPRLHGTVEDEAGNRVTGYISWDLDEILQSDVLDAETMDGRDDHDVSFGEVASIERIAGGARVVLVSGEAVELTGSNDVDRGNRGVQVSDPELGMVEVEWREFRMLTLHPAPTAIGYDAFDGGRPLVGRVTLQSGEVVEGLIRWDADEGSSWELLDGATEEADFTVEFSRIAKIVRGEVFGATVTLRDGRSYELDRSNDVDWDNKGILVIPEDGGAGAEWRLVTWDEFMEIEFRHGPRLEAGGGNDG